jgi:hypothetical protein
MLFALSLSQNLKPTVRYLQEEVLLQREGGGVLAKLVACYPQVLGLNMENNIGPKLKFLREEVTIVPRRTQCNNRTDLHPQPKLCPRALYAPPRLRNFACLSGRDIGRRDCYDCAAKSIDSRERPLVAHTASRPLPLGEARHPNGADWPHVCQVPSPADRPTKCLRQGRPACAVQGASNDEGSSKGHGRAIPEHPHPLPTGECPSVCATSRGRVQGAKGSHRQDADEATKRTVDEGLASAAGSPPPRGCRPR